MNKQADKKREVFNRSVAQQRPSSHRSRPVAGSVLSVSGGAGSTLQRKIQQMADRSEHSTKLGVLAHSMESSAYSVAQRSAMPQGERKQENNTGLPDNLKQGVEQLSGVSMEGAQVHYNSTQPAQLNALAFAQGNQIHVGPRQEKHLPHEAWHVAQKKQGRVKPTVQRVDVQINDDQSLEHEADVMGAKANAMQLKQSSVNGSAGTTSSTTDIVQRRLPPGSAVETELMLGGGQNSAYTMLYRLMHMEVSQNRLLRVLDSTPYADANDAVNDVFPNGKFNADAYAALYAINQQYSEVLPASQSIRDNNWQTLQPVLARAIQLATRCASRDNDIEAVFGPNAEVLKISATYLQVGQRLGGFNQNNFTIDYHGDDAEMGVGGYTSPGSGKIQVSPAMLAKDDNTLAVLLLHEGCHEINGTIIDSGYYGTARFTQMSPRQKIRNAAHYEEVARRVIGNSIYPGQTFQPVAQQQVQGGRRADLIRKVKPASEGLRELWNTSANLHGMMRDITSGASALQPQLQVMVVKAIKQGFELPASAIGDAPVVTEFDIALMESTTKVFNRAMTAINRFKKEVDPNERDRLCQMTTTELALEAISRVGGFQGLDPSINVTAINQIRTAVIMGLQQPDPFPDFGEG